MMKNFQQRIATIICIFLISFIGIGVAAINFTDALLEIPDQQLQEDVTELESFVVEPEIKAVENTEKDKQINLNMWI